MVGLAEGVSPSNAHPNRLIIMLLDFDGNLEKQSNRMSQSQKVCYCINITNGSTTENGALTFLISSDKWALNCSLKQISSTDEASSENVGIKGKLSGQLYYNNYYYYLST